MNACLSWSAAVCRLACLAAALAPAPLFASRLEVDAKVSSVHFYARSTGHTVAGTVGRWALELTVPEGSDLPDAALFRAEVPTMSTDHRKRDEEMWHWIEPDRFSSITFRLRSLEKSASGHTAVGELELHGTKAPLSMPVVIRREGQRLVLHGEAIVDHRKFGLAQIRKFGFLTVDPEVRIVFDVAGDLQ